MNVGMVGMGKMGLLHAGILACIDGVKVTAVADKEDMVKNYIKRALPAINVYNDYQKMLADEDLDVVYIATPVSFHAPVADLCIDRGMNFFVEKPLASSVNDCKELCNRLKGSGLVHAVGYSKKFLDTFSKAKELLNSNMLGDLMHVKSSMYVSQIFTSGKGWRYRKHESGGGVLLEFASHLVDLLLWYFGPIEYVSAISKSYYSTEVEDFAHSTLEFANGLKGYLDTSWSVRNYRLPEITIEVHGSNGMMIVNDDYIRIKLDNKDGTFPAGSTTMYKQALSSGTIIDIGGPEYTKEDIHMIECVNDKKQTISNSFEASKTQSVVEAMYLSAAYKAFKKVDYMI